MQEFFLTCKPSCAVDISHSDVGEEHEINISHSGAFEEYEVKSLLW